MSKKNDISVFKKIGASKEVLQAETPVPIIKRAQSKKMGRPKVAEPRTYKIVLAFTEKEGKLIENKRGLIDRSVFVMSKLRETDLLK